MFRTGTDAVRVHVLVSDRGRPVPGLAATDFELLDNGVRQTVQLVESGTAPLIVSLVFDTSESVAGERLRYLISATSALLDTLERRDRVALIVFDNSVRTLIPDTSDLDAVRRALAGVTAGGRTSLNDAAYAGLIGGQPEEGRRLVVLFSDGADNQSWLSRDAVLRAAGRTEAVVYGVSLRDRLASQGAEVVRSLIEALPAATGGQLLRADADRDLEPLFLRVVSEFRHRYWLAYLPTGVRTGDGWHTISVRTRDRRTKVTARPGYFSPAGGCKPQRPRTPGSDRHSRDRSAGQKSFHVPGRFGADSLDAGAAPSIRRAEEF
jgi:VWFA-related protein